MVFNLATIAVAAAIALTLFLISLASLLRLSAIGALGNAAGQVVEKPGAEPLIHSGLRLAVVVYLTVALSRTLLSPNYEGGIFSPDGNLLWAGITSFVSSIPAVPLIFLLARRADPGTVNPNLVVMTVTLAAVSIVCGGGQMATVAIAAGVLPSAESINWVAAGAAAMVVGFVTCFGVTAHFWITRRITSARGHLLRLCLLDSLNGAVTTVVSVVAACAFWQLEA